MMDEKKFLEITKNFRYSSRTNNHIFVHEEKPEKINSHFTNEYSKLKDYGVDSLEDTEFKDRFCYIDDVLLLSSENELWFNFYRIKRNKVISTIDDSLKIPGFQEVNQLDIIPVRLYLDSGYLIIRYSDHDYAQSLIRDLVKIDEMFKCHPIHFSKKNKEAALEGACVRTAKIEFGQDKTYKETAKFAVGVNKTTDQIVNLQTISDRFRLALEDPNRNINYISISTRRDPNDTSSAPISASEDTLTIRINFEDSKIYFSSFMYEDEIKYWIKKILAKCNLSLNREAIQSNIEDDVDEFRD